MTQEDCSFKCLCNLLNGLSQESRSGLSEQKGFSGRKVLGYSSEKVQHRGKSSLMMINDKGRIFK